MAIELFATAVVSGAENLWKHYNSIDHPVERYVVVNNSEGQFPEVSDVIDKIVACSNDFVAEAVIVNNRMNAGFGGAVNQVIKQNIDCNYWFITNDDWHVSPVSLPSWMSAWRMSSLVCSVMEQMPTDIHLL